MFSSPILDLIILLSFIYFVGSLILSSINEAIAGTLRLRPYQLRNALKNLFFDSKPDTKSTDSNQTDSTPITKESNPPLLWEEWVNTNLNKSPHIQSLMKKEDKYPSYIPAKNFVLAIIGEIGPDKYTAADLQATLTASNLPLVLVKVLKDLAAQGGNDLATFEKNVEEFYNNAMDRAGGVYKKWIRLMLIILAIFISVSLNLDTLKIAKDELSNKAKLSQDVDNIVKQVPSITMNKDTSESVTIKTSSGGIVVNRTKQPNQKFGDKSVKGATDTSLNHNVKTIGQLSMYLMQTSGYSTGYSEAGGFQKQWTSSWSAFFLKLAGILITAFALQLSSNFWFDLMSKAVNVRAAGKKPQTDKKSK